jgi:hypothetical protein
VPGKACVDCEDGALTGSGRQKTPFSDRFQPWFAVKLALVGVQFATFATLFKPS